MGMVEVLTGLGAALMPAVIRGVGGWAENAMEDGEISVFEWKELGATVLRVGIMTCMVYFGWQGFVGDVNAFASGAAAFVLDKIFFAMKK